MLLLALLIALIIGSSRLFTPLPASVGLPDPVIIEAPPLPTAAPTPLEAPAQPQPPTQSERLPPTAELVPPPTPLPAPIVPPVFPSDAEPVAVEGDPNDDCSGSAEPYPVNGPTGSGRSHVACGVRVVHVVRPGENLFRIALRYNTTILSIARRNGIADTRMIRPGQRLTIVTCR